MLILHFAAFLVVLLEDSPQRNEVLRLLKIILELFCSFFFLEDVPGLFYDPGVLAAAQSFDYLSLRAIVFSSDYGLNPLFIIVASFRICG